MQNNPVVVIDTSTVQDPPIEYKGVDKLPNSRFSKKFIVLGIFVVLVIIVLLGINSLSKVTKNSQSGKTTTTKAVFEDSTPLATFNNTTIYVKDLNALALEQYGKSEAKNLDHPAVDLRNLLDTYVQRKILDSQNVGDITKELAQAQKDGLTGNPAKYEAIKQKLINTKIKSWQLYSIGFWLIQVDDVNKESQERKQLSIDIENALNFAKTEMQQGTSVYDIANQIQEKYPSLNKILAVNSYIFNGPDSTNSAIWNAPTTYYYNKENLDAPFYKTLYGMNEKSPVTIILNNGQMGGSVVKIIKVNNPDGILDNYQNWLKNQQSTLVINTKILNNSKDE